MLYEQFIITVNEPIPFVNKVFHVEYFATIHLFDLEEEPLQPKVRRKKVATLLQY